MTTKTPGTGSAKDCSMQLFNDLDNTRNRRYFRTTQNVAAAVVLMSSARDIAL